MLFGVDGFSIAGVLSIGFFETDLRAQPYLLAIFGNLTIAQQ